MSTFVHMELSTSDLKAAKQFYKGLFGWKYQDVKMSDGVYTMVTTAEGAGIGGIQQNPTADTPSHWLGYVGVASVKKSLVKVEKLGGKVVLGATPVPNMGTMAILMDPQGAMIAIWEAAAPAPAPAQADAPAQKKPAEKSGGKKAAAKQPEAKKPEAKKVADAPEKKPAEKSGGKKAAAKKAEAKKPAAKKPEAKKVADAPEKKPAEKSGGKKVAAKPAEAPAPAQKSSKKAAKKAAKK